MVSLAELRARNVQPVWQEAVAVVQELIQSSTTSGTPLPDLEHVALIPNGDVVAMPGSPESADPVRQAATMLRALVDGIATPPELEEFIKKNLSGAAAPTLADFARGLSFYERPGRRADVERLVSRVTAAEQITRADEELRRLKEKATVASDSRLEDTVFMDTVAMTGRRRPVAAIALVALAVIAAAGALWWWRDRAGAPQPSAPAAAAASKVPAAPGASGATGTSGATGATGVGTSASTSSAATGPSAAQGVSASAQGATAKTAQTAAVASNAVPTAPAANAPASSAPSAPAPSAPTPSLYDRAKAAVQSAVNSIVGPEAEPEHAAAAPPPPAPVAPKKHHKKAPSVPAPSPEEMRTPVVVAVDVPAPTPEMATTPQTDVLPVVEDLTIYSLHDSVVIPPVLVRPVLPKDPPPGVPLDQIGTMEVLVDEQGDVEQVHLVSPANRFHDRMLVSAAKMWKFRPAFKDGHPVRYLTRIRLTV
jgi:hypothetical protein